MLQSVATIAFLLMAAAGAAVIAAALADDWAALRVALGLAPVARRTSPTRIRAMAPVRRARIVRVSPQAVSTRAAA